MLVPALLLSHFITLAKSLQKDFQVIKSIVPKNNKFRSKQVEYLKKKTWKKATRLS